MIELAAALLLTLPAVHTDSASTSHLVVEGARVSLAMLCQAPTIIESLGGDGDGDGRLDDAELATLEERLAEYVLAGWTVRADGQRLTGALTSLAPLAAPQAGEMSWLELKLAYTATRPLEDLDLAFDLFASENPGHRDFAAVTWNGAEPRTFVLGGSHRTWSWDPDAGVADAALDPMLPGGTSPGEELAAAEPDRASAGRSVEGSGAEGSRADRSREATGGAEDHSGALGLACLLLLVSRVAGPRPAVLLVLTFAAAGAAASWLALGPGPGRWGALAAPLFVAYLGVHEWSFRRPRAPWTEAVAGGGLLGLGLGAAPGGLGPLAWCALWVGAGLLSVSLCAWARGPVGRDHAPGERAERLVPAGVRSAVAGVAVVAGLYLFAARAGFV